MWCLRRGVILIKDNLANRNWHGRLQCWSCHHDETIKHMFFQCKFPHYKCYICSMTCHRVANIFGNWLCGMDHMYIIFIRVGAVAIRWSLLLCTITWLLMVRTLLLWMSFIGGHLYNVWRTYTFLWRSVWRMWHLSCTCIVPDFLFSFRPGVNSCALYHLDEKFWV